VFAAHLRPSFIYEKYSKLAFFIVLKRLLKVMPTAGGDEIHILTILGLTSFTLKKIMAAFCWHKNVKQLKVFFQIQILHENKKMEIIFLFTVMLNLMFMNINACFFYDLRPSFIYQKDFKIDYFNHF
jgi:hypothetical protein